MDVVAQLLAGVVGAAVAWAGANKVTGFTQWMAAARAQALPRPVATVVPAVELVLGVALVVTSPSAVLLGLVTLLLVVFTVFLGVQVSRGSTVPCACFGTRASKPPSGRDVVRNLAMIAALFAAAVLS